MHLLSCKLQVVIWSQQEANLTFAKNFCQIFLQTVKQNIHSLIV